VGRISARCVLSVIAAIATTSCSSSSGSPGSPPAAPGPTEVTTDKGVVQGSVEPNARQFLDIPYAAPPTGPLRWQPPADAAPWSGVRNAGAYGGACPQYDLLNGTPSDNSEDCLQLNVWTPLVTTTNAPVMVFFHGGAFVSGTGTDPTYNGANLAAAGNVVTINYRFGPFGFLAHPALLTGGASANLGLLDQRAALAWVQRNIAAFGGNPVNVTMFGESAGAYSVCTQLTMPKSAGFFQHALMESGACDGPVYFSMTDAIAQAASLATAVGCTDATTAATCLRALTTDQILSALPIRNETIGPMGVLWGPVYEDPELPMRPIDALNGGSFTKVPLLLGTNLNEGQLFSALYDGSLGPSDVSAIISWMFGASNVTVILGQYPASAYPDTKSQVADIVTDGIFACPTRRAARAVSAAGVPTFLYQLAYPFSITLAPGAVTAHGYELPFVFGNDFYGTRLPVAALPLSATVMDYWTTYATGGNPNGHGASTWPAYTTMNDTNLELNIPITTAAGTDKAKCDFWDGLL
jgi:para-nitrobenzyl esterase